MPERATLVRLHGILAAFAEQLSGMEWLGLLGRGRLCGLGRVFAVVGCFLGDHGCSFLVVKVLGRV
jgi:hypothetical protein